MYELGLGGYILWFSVGILIAFVEIIRGYFSI